MTRRFLLSAGVAWAQEKPEITFGTTVASSSGFEGKIYMLKHGALELPRFREQDAVGTIYTNSLYVPPQQFDRGFPGITARFEWFAIDYKAKFWIEQEANYQFHLLSDDGSRLWVDGKELIDNDGQHAPAELVSSATLTRGVHHIRVAYFQGPGDKVALVLGVKPPGQKWKVFDTKDFRPPADESTWSEGSIRKIKRASNR